MKRFLRIASLVILDSELRLPQGPSAGDSVASLARKDVTKDAEANSNRIKCKHWGRLAELAVICRALPDLSDDKQSGCTD